MPRWTQKELAMFEKYTDEQIVEKTGRTCQAVITQRRRVMNRNKKKTSTCTSCEKCIEPRRSFRQKLRNLIG